MRKSVTTALVLILAVIASGAVSAQTVVTIREINAIPQANIDFLNSQGLALTEDQVIENLVSDYSQVTDVQFTAVVLADPRKSGLSSPNDEGQPSRIHYFVRDVTAATEGPGGHDLQIVDGNYRTTGSINLNVGDVATFTGTVSYFSGAIQFSPETITFLDTYVSYGLPADFIDPVPVAIGDLNATLAELQIQANWSNFNTLNQQYVVLEDVLVWRSPDRFGDRPPWYLQDANGDLVGIDDISLRFRNDQSDYDGDDFDVLDDQFVAPPAGASVTVQGFAVLRTAFDPEGVAVPGLGALRMVPWTDEDLVVLESPPNVLPQGLAAVPGDEVISLDVEIEIHAARTLDSAQLMYRTSSNNDFQTVDPTSVNGDIHTFEIPAQPDGEFVWYKVEATDNEGGVSTTAENEFRVLFDGINEIADVQRTFDDDIGDGPFAGYELDMDLVVTLQTDPSTTNLTHVQDGTDPWSGISIFTSALDAYSPGDQVRITHAQVSEFRGTTQFSNIVFDEVATGGDPYDYVAIANTNLLQDGAIAESYEGMLLSFGEVIVVETNSDAPSGPFGEFSVSTDGTVENSIRVDDLSDLISYDGQDPATVYAVWEKLEFIRGAWYESFFNHKLAPESEAADIGPVTNTDTEVEDLPGTFALDQNYPNPFNPSTSITYEIGRTTQVSLNVFDVLGRRVRSLVSREQAPGSYTVQFDAFDLASGVYMYRLSAGSTLITRTMLLMK